MDVEDEEYGQVFWDSWNTIPPDEAVFEKEVQVELIRRLGKMSRAEKWIVGARFGFFDPGPYTYRMIANQAFPYRSKTWAQQQVERLVFVLRNGIERGPSWNPTRETSRIEHVSKLLGFEQQEGKW